MEPHDSRTPFTFLLWFVCLPSKFLGTFMRNNCIQAAPHIAWNYCELIEGERNSMLAVIVWTWALLLSACHLKAMRLNESLRLNRCFLIILSLYLKIIKRF